MPPGSEDQEVLIQLAEMRQEMNSMGAALQEIKNTVKEVVTLDRTIAELSIYHQQQAKEIQTQWAKIDTQQKDIEKVERKSDEWINRARGAWSTGVILGSTAQIIVLAMVGWTFNHIRDAEDEIIRLKSQVMQIEQRQTDQQQRKNGQNEK
jgi:t-SNARE complex subunit (syntaxin)